MKMEERERDAFSIDRKAQVHYSNLGLWFLGL